LGKLRVQISKPVNLQEAKVVEKVKTALTDQKPFTIQLRLAAEDKFMLFDASFRQDFASCSFPSHPFWELEGISRACNVPNQSWI